MCFVYFPQFKKAREGLKIHPGLTLLEVAQMADVRINADCGGTGKCGKCLVRVESGHENLNQPTSLEKSRSLGEKERLACQARILRDKADMNVYIENFGEYDILKYGMERATKLCPLYENRESKIHKNGREIAAYSGRLLGLAVDIGTTTVVFDLVNLENGDIIETVAKTNPQISYGNDIISRIEYTLVNKKTGQYFQPEERAQRVRTLQKIIIDLLNGSIKDLSSNGDGNISKDIYHVIVSGNSTMRNICFGMDVSSLGIMPYEAADKKAITATPAEIGIDINPAGSVYGTALIGGHVGGDILSGIIASEMYKSDELCLLIDIGTNGEVVLGNKYGMIAASCAAGGAFEGSTIHSGVGGIQGAIKKIEIIEGRVIYSTIADKYPIGICGSGFIDLLAELLKNGIMTTNAKIPQDFHITGSLKITQNDIYQLITSKAAVKTGWEVLLKEFPAGINDISRIYLSGGFGNFINTRNAMKIGLIPEVEEAIVFKIGNGSLEGAREMLLCKDTQTLSEQITSKIRHINTNEVEKDFEYMMACNMYF